MKLFLSLILWTVILLKACYSTHVVTRFQGVEEYYLQSVRDMPDISKIYHLITTPMTMREICRPITQTHYFQVRLESPLIEADKKTRLEIEKKHPEVYNYYYVFSDAVHRYMQLPVSAGGKRIMQYLWPCFVRSQRTQQIVQYYLTASKRHQPFFLLGYDNNENLVVHALVEEHAMSMIDMYGRPVVNSLFGKAVQKKINGMILCKLDQSQMLRLCHVVMQSSGYSRYLTFWPSRYNVVSTCVERSVFSKTSPTDTSLIEYKMWMIGCKSRRLKSQKAETIYISETDKSKYAVVYVKNRVGGLFVDDIVYNVHLLEHKRPS